jgi:hypothetical protein
MKIHPTQAIIIIFLTAMLCIPISASQTNDNPSQLSPLLSDGLILYSPMFGTTTYLRNADGSINHTWSSVYYPGCMVWWLGDYSIMRTIRVGVGPGAGGAGGGVQKVLSDGSVTWDYRYNSNGDLSHHDLYVLPNGNVLLIAWETKTRTDAIAQGRNPSYVSNQGLMPDHVIEVQPTGPSSGTIVWEWHVWDHLIQDYDSSKANYGVVGDHPELVDINCVTSSSSDWMHTNSIDYNPTYDQIMISVHNFGEIWIIDHSTTTEEAAGHTGGHYGHGGDLIYRWGNPANYDAGTSSNKKLFSQHDASWIKPGLPGAGDILVFNNGADRPGSHYSTVDQFTTPINESGYYYLEPGTAYGPTDFTWEYIANPPTSFYASHLSGAHRLANGDTLICNGESGKLFEVTPDKATVWQYSLSTEILKIEYFTEVQGPTPEEPNLDCSGSLTWTDVKPGATVTGSFTIQNIGNANSLLNWSVDTSLLTWGNWTITPSSGMGLTPEAGSITVQVSVIAPADKKQEFEGYVKVVNQNNASDFDTVPVTLTTPADYHAQGSFLLQYLQNLFPRLFQHYYQHVWWWNR